MVSEIKIKHGKNEVIVKKDAKGKVSSVKGAKGKKSVKGYINKGPKLKINGHTITSISDDTIIHTHDSPGCVWYFCGGRWWRICF